MVLILLGANSSAWGPQAREMFCRNSVELAWGQEYLNSCIPKGEYGKLVSEQIDALYPSPESKLDYTTCPITQSAEGRWLCGNSSQNPTGELSEYWFRKSEQAGTMCDRIIYYCIGADFYVNQFHPLHHVKYTSPAYYQKFNEIADAHIRAGDANWRVRERVVFEAFENLTGASRRSRYVQDMTLGSKDFEKALEGLHERAVLIEMLEFPKTTTTSLPKTPTVSLIDMPPATTTVKEVILPAAKGGESNFYLVFAAAVLALVAFVAYSNQLSRTKPLEEREAETNLFKIPGINHETVDKLLEVDIQSIQQFMGEQPAKVAKKTAIPLEQIKAMKKAQRDAVREYFLLTCPLSADDLTSTQKEAIIKHKKNLGSMMTTYRNKSRLTPKQLSDLDEIMRPLSPEKAEQVQRLIDGKVDPSEDLPYRILVTSAEIDLGKIKGG